MRRGLRRLMKVRLVDIDLNDTTFMSRLEFDDIYISNLADDMRQFDQRNPVGLQRKGNMYQLVYGWCRVKAAKLLGWEIIEARVFEGLSNLQAQLHNISDNVTHESLSTLEIAYQIKKLRSAHGVTVKEIAKLYGDKVQLVYDLLTLTRMKEEIRQAVHRGEIGLTHAIEINKFPVSNQLEFLEETINEGLSTSKLKRMRSSRIQSEVVRKVTSRLSDKELEELVIQSEYKRFQKFLLEQVDAETAYQNGREGEVADWILSLDALRRAYNWKPPEVTQRINTTIFSIVHARAHLEEESDVYETPNEYFTNRELLKRADLRQDPLSRKMLGWLIREGVKFQASSCYHHWLSEKNTGKEYCIHCGIGRYANLSWDDPPNEPQPAPSR